MIYGSRLFFGILNTLFRTGLDELEHIRTKTNTEPQRHANAPIFQASRPTARSFSISGIRILQRSRVP